MAEAIDMSDAINNIDNHTGFYLQPYTDRLEIRYLKEGKPQAFIMLKWEDFHAMRKKATECAPIVEIPYNKNWSDDWNE